MAEMTGKERYLCALHGETPDKVPILHWSSDLCQALSGVPMYQYAYDPEKIALGCVRYIQKYEPDVSAVSYDLWHQLEPYGVEVYITDNLIYPKKTLADRNTPDPKIYEELEYRDPFAGKRTQIFRKACEIVSEEVGDKVALRPGAYGATSNLALLVGVREALRDVILFPEAYFKAAAGVMMDWTVAYATGLIEPYKDKLTSFTFGFASLDADLLPPEFADEVARLEVESLNRIKEKTRKITGHDVPITTHTCGARPNLDLIAEKFGDMLDELQYWAGSDYGSDYPLEDAVTKLGDRYVISSGIDHTRTLLLGSPEEVDEMVKGAMDIAKGRCRFVLASGCELGIGPPDANMLALVEARDKYGGY
jgi:uroporphyrinogen-III decarboxylase